MRALITLILLGVVGLGAAQEETTYFKGFSKLPNHIPDSIYAAANTASGTERLAYLEKIAEAHYLQGSTDSIIHYGNLMRRETMDMPLDNASKAYFKSKSLAILGMGKLRKGLVDAALKDFLEGMAFTTDQGDSALLNTHRLGMAGAYIQRNEFDKSKRVLATIVGATSRPYFLGRAYNYYGDLALYESNLDKAKEYYGKAKENIEKEGDIKAAMHRQFGMARISELEGRMQEALDQYQAIKDRSLKGHFYDIYITAILNMGRLYAQEQQEDAAEAVLSTAYLNAMSWNRLELQKKVLRELRQFYYRKGDYENAHNLMTQYIRVSEAIANAQDKAIVEELEVRYQTLEKEKEIYTLKEAQLLKEGQLARQKTIKNAILIGFLVILGPIVALLYLYYQKLQAQSMLNKKQEEVNDQKVRALLREQELQLVRTGIAAENEARTRIAMELHDSIGGNLAGIKLQLGSMPGIADGGQSVLAQINETYEQVRNISHDLMPQKLKENSFVNLLRHYLENLSRGSGFNIVFAPYPKALINALSERYQVDIFKIIKELLANVIKYADAKQVEIHLNLDQEGLQLIFEDDGRGFDVRKASEGIGLRNIRKRLSALEGEMNIDSIPDRGTAISIRIPINQENEKS